MKQWINTPYKPTDKVYYFGLIEKLFELQNVIDKKEYHPEENVFSHSIQCWEISKRLTDDKDIQLACLMHDISKPDVNHSEVGYKLAKEHVSEKTAWLIKNHMRVWYLITGEMTKQGKIKELKEHKWFKDLIILAMCDKQARDNNFGWKIYKPIEFIDYFKEVNETKKRIPRTTKKTPK